MLLRGFKILYLSCISDTSTSYSLFLCLNIAEWVAISTVKIVTSDRRTIKGYTWLIFLHFLYENILCVFLFCFPTYKHLLKKRAYSKSKDFAPEGSKFFPFRVGPFSGQKHFDRVASAESVSIPFQVRWWLWCFMSPSTLFRSSRHWSSDNKRQWSTVQSSAELWLQQDSNQGYHDPKPGALTTWAQLFKVNDIVS